MNWLLGYLLTGFVLAFIAFAVCEIRSPAGWKWDLASVLLWPLVIAIVAVETFVKSRRERRFRGRRY